jgi:hypothetical protein
MGLGVSYLAWASGCARRRAGRAAAIGLTPGYPDILKLPYPCHWLHAPMTSDPRKTGQPPQPTPGDARVGSAGDGADRQLRDTDAGAVDAFLRQVAAIPRRAPAGARGRLIFALDATASREPTWDQAMRIQSAMFTETRDLGGLEVQLCYYRGVLDFSASPWCLEARELVGLMSGVHCAAGLTQIGRVLDHALDEAARGRVNALVFIGDCVEESADALAGLAGRLGLQALPAFVFQEGGDPVAERCFRQIARLSGGAYAPFDARSPQVLRDLLSAVAVYAAGGRKALAQFGRSRGGAVLQLTHQVPGGGG